MNTKDLGRKAVAVLLMLVSMTSAIAQGTIPGVGTVVKKKPGNSPIVAPPTDRNGRFSIKLSAGEYTFAVNHTDVDTAIAQIIKQQNIKTPYDGTGVEVAFDKAPGVTITRGQTTPSGNYKADRSSSEITIVIALKSATLSGQVSWNDEASAKRASVPQPQQPSSVAPAATTLAANDASGSTGGTIRETRVYATSSGGGQVSPLAPGASRTRGIGNRFRSASKAPTAPVAAPMAANAKPVETYQ